MNTKNNLHNALNKAFENHVEPLNEAQWRRLEGAIIQKKKRRFFPFFLLFLAISFTAGITYFLTLNFSGFLGRSPSPVSTAPSLSMISKPSMISPNTEY